jgi:hypothetical protein
MRLFATYGTKGYWITFVDGKLTPDSVFIVNADTGQSFGLIETISLHLDLINSVFTADVEIDSTHHKFILSGVGNDE